MLVEPHPHRPACRWTDYDLGEPAEQTMKAINQPCLSIFILFQTCFLHKVWDSLRHLGQPQVEVPRNQDGGRKLHWIRLSPEATACQNRWEKWRTYRNPWTPCNCGGPCLSPLRNGPTSGASKASLNKKHPLVLIPFDTGGLSQRWVPEIEIIETLWDNTVIKHDKTCWKKPKSRERNPPMSTHAVHWDALLDLFDLQSCCELCVWGSKITTPNVPVG